MKTEEVKVLIDKYFHGEATEEERERLLSWYRQRNARMSENFLIYPEDEGKVRDRILSEIDAYIGKGDRKNYPFRSVFRYAAIVLGFVMLTLTGRYMYDRLHMKEYQVPTNADENRYIYLPDSSMVLLRAGAKLSYPKEFDGNTREVSLQGEAYFDISQVPGKPFIIHTGDVKTTVLGTAFNIKSDEDGKLVQVSVARGKVRVESAGKEKINTVLIADQELTYDIRQQEVIPKQEVRVVETKNLEWIREDMGFDNMSFGALAEKLNRRYGVHIRFANEQLKNCPISGYFNGTENLNEVLTTLCRTRNATFIQNGTDILIQGEGCQIF